MSYKYSRGPVVQGDIKGADDAQRDTGINFEDDYIGFETSGSATMVVSGSKVGIGTTTPDYELHVAGDIGVDHYIRHNGDGNTHINFTDDKIVLKAGNKAMVTMEEKGSAPHEITLNDGGNNIDFVVKGNGSNAGNPLFACDASTGRVGINGVGSPAYELDVAGDIGLSEFIYHKGDEDTFIKFGDNAITLKAGGKSMFKASASVGSIFVNNGGHDIDFVVRNAVTGTLLHTDAGNSRVGIGTASPIAELDVAGKIAITAESSTPSQPSDGQGYLYSKSDGKIYWRSHDLSETDLTATGGGGGGGSASLIVGFNTINGASGDVDHDCSTNQTFYHNQISGAFSPNFTNLSISNGQATVTKLVLDQGATPHVINNVSVGGTESLLVWEGSRPNAAANSISFAKFEILKISNNYSVIGSFSSTVAGGPVTIPSNALLFLDASNSDSYNGSGTTWTDLSSEGNNATLVNSPSFSSPDKWFEFTGNSSQHITLPTGFADFTSGATFFFVANLGVGNHWERLLDFSGGSSTPINVGRNASSTTMTLEYYNPSKTATSSNIIQNDTLANYVITTDGSNAKFYRNGSLITTNSFTRTPDNNDRTQNYIARSRAGGDAYYEGQIAVVGIFNRTLSESEITDLYDYYDVIYNL